MANREPTPQQPQVEGEAQDIPVVSDTPPEVEVSDAGAPEGTVSYEQAAAILGDQLPDDASGTAETTQAEVAAVENEASSEPQEPFDVQWGKFLLETVEVPDGDGVKQTTRVRLIDELISKDKQSFLERGGDPKEWNFDRAVAGAFVGAGIVSQEELGQESFTQKDLANYLRTAHKIRRESAPREPRQARTERRTEQASRQERAQAQAGTQAEAPAAGPEAPAASPETGSPSVEQAAAKTQEIANLLRELGDAPDKAAKAAEIQAAMAELETLSAQVIAEANGELPATDEQDKSKQLRERLIKAREKWQGDIMKLGAMPDKQSPKALALHQQIKREYAEVQAIESEIYDMLAAELAATTADSPETGDDDTEAAAEGPAREELEATRDELLEQYDAIEDKNSDEAKAVYARLRETLTALSAGDQPAAGDGSDAAPADGENNAPTPDEKLAKIMRELDPALTANYEAALSEYAELKATSETVGRFRRGRVEDELKLAEEKLTRAKIELETEIARKKAIEGLYEGDTDEAKRQQLEDDIFNKLRGLDAATREKTDRVLETRLNERGWFKRKVASIGKFFTSGGKVAQLLKPGGAGFALGFGVGFMGAGFPVTTAAAVAGGAGMRAAATRVHLDTLHAANKGKLAVSDEKFRELLNSIGGSTGDIGEKAQALAGGILTESREKGYELANAARKKAGKVAVAFAIGFGAGGLGGHLAHEAWSSAHAAEVPTNSEPAPQTNPNPSGGEVSGGGAEQTPSLNGQEFNVESGHGPIKEIQDAARANGNNISLGRAEQIYNQLYGEYGDALTGGGPEYHGPTGDLRFGRPGTYNWGDGVLEKIVAMSK